MVENLLEKIYKKFRKNRTKIFCIGFGKTGTTSIERLFLDSDLILGNQAKAEMLAKDWGKVNQEKKFIKYCRTADAFQDVPFMFDNLFVLLDKEFPNSKFVLTVRDDSNQWYDSLVRFHTKLFSKNGDVPTENDLAEAEYRYKGFTLDMFKMFWNYPEVSLYDKEFYTNKYNTYNAKVIDYFKNRPSDFICINVGVKSDFNRLVEFLNLKTTHKEFPWENKT